MGVTPSLLSGGYLTSPDSYTIADYAENIINYHQILPHTVYPTIQIIITLVSTMTGMSITSSLTFLIGFSVGMMVILTFLLSRLLIHSTLAATLAGFFVISLPFIGRAIVLTPQNIIGFLFFVLTVNCGALYITCRNNRRLLAFLFSSGMLLLVHPLSFGVFFLSLLVFLVIYFWQVLSWRHWLTAIIALLVILYLGLIMISYELTGSTNATLFITRLLVEISTSGLNDSIIRYQTYPSVFGSLTINIIVAAIFIFTFHYRLSKYSKSIIFVLFLVPLVWANLYLVGINFLSYRVILFLWLPASILVGYFVYWYKTRNISTNIPLAFVAILIVMYSSLGFQTVYSHYSNYGKNFVPTKDDEEALEWLSNNTRPDDRIMGIERWPKIQNIIFSFLYPKMNFFIVTDLTEKRDLPTPPIDFAEQPSQGKLLGKLILTLAPKNIRNDVYRVDNAAYKERVRLYYASKLPDSTIGKDVLNQMGITRVYIYKDIEEYKTFWESLQFIRIYSNNSVAIFKRVNK